MQTVDRDDVHRLVQSGGQLVEVLPREEYDWAHLPKAEHVYLRELDERARNVLDQRRPVITYCNDFL